jgi:flagellar motor switch protein FliN/FliY
MKDQAARPDLGPLGSVPVELSVCVGRAHPTVADLMGLTSETVLPLDRGVSDPVEIYANDRLVARGELAEAEEGGGMLVVRLTEIVRCDVE